MIHLSEMSWAKKVRKPGDMVKPGDVVEVMILGVNAAERRMSLGLKQTLGDPWAEAPEKFPAGSEVEGPITSFTKFGAFVQLAEGIEGMIHVSEISAEKRIERPQDVLRAGQVVKAKVLDVDKEKRQLRLSMKQLVPTGLDEYIAEHKVGQIVSGPSDRDLRRPRRRRAGRRDPCQRSPRPRRLRRKSNPRPPRPIFLRSAQCWLRDGRMGLRQPKQRPNRSARARFAASASRWSIAEPRR